eukprot:4687-Heterococcus_DN1.PRE.8
MAVHMCHQPRHTYGVLYASYCSPRSPLAIYLGLAWHVTCNRPLRCISTLYSGVCQACPALCGC